MKKIKFKVNAKGLLVSIGERTITVNNKLSEADAILISEQFPKEKYVEIIDTKSTENGTITTA